jgi:hypothetical protein
MGIPREPKFWPWKMPGIRQSKTRTPRHSTVCWPARWFTFDYDGSLMDKAKFMASVKAPSLHPEQIVNESMTAYMYGGSAVVTGIYREKGVRNGKPYSRRGRFTDTWVNQSGTWVCASSQSTLISN